MENIMYITELQLDLKNRATINWLRNPYKIHQRLWMAMPEEVKERHKDKEKSSIKDRLPSPFLFRVEPEFIKNGRAYPRILVQTVIVSDWETAFEGTKFLQENGITTKSLNLDFIKTDGIFQFDVKLNPTKKIKNYRLLFKDELKDYPAKYSRKEHAKYLEGKRKLEELKTSVTKEQREKLPSVRIGIYDEEEQIQWLKKKAFNSDKPESDHGFEILKAEIKNLDDKIELRDSIFSGAVEINMAKKGDEDISFLSVDYSGILKVTDPEKFTAALTTGIGRAKAFGCGLLLIKRV
jgi:CRISPR system Cascade subunit CasE